MNLVRTQILYAARVCMPVCDLIFLNRGAKPKRQRLFPHLGKVVRLWVRSSSVTFDHVQGWLEEVSGGSEWSFPQFIVPMPVPADSLLLEKWKLVIDFDYLNSQTKEDKAPLPLVEDMLIHESHKMFSVLHLKHGFQQMPLHTDDRYLTAMPTPFGTLQWTVLPMGVKNSLAQFQCVKK